MITQNEYKLVETLSYEKEMLQDLLKSFNSKYVRSGIGLISYYDDFKQQPDKNENYAQFFENNFKELIAEFNDKTKSIIKNRIKHIDVDIEKYIKKEEKNDNNI